MTTEHENGPQIIEAALFAAAEPLSISKLQELFAEEDRPSNEQVREWLNQLEGFYETRGIALVKVASGFRFQARETYAPWLQRLWEKKPPRYTRALLETLALVAYRQPITRGEIEDVRGVAVSTNIMKTLIEREWVKIVGHKEVPGKPALYGTTKVFLDYFNLKTLSQLPALKDLVNLDELEQQVEAAFGPAEEQATFTMEEEQEPEVLESSSSIVSNTLKEIGEETAQEVESEAEAEPEA